MSHTPPPYYPPPPPPPPRKKHGAAIAWFVVACVAAALTGGGVAIATKDGNDGGGDSFANPVACKTALAENYREAVAAGPDAPTASAPPACVGLDRAALERITGEVVAEFLESPEAEQLFEDGLESGLPSP